MRAGLALLVLCCLFALSSARPQLYYAPNASAASELASKKIDGFAVIERTPEGALLVRSEVPPKLLFPGVQFEHFRKSAHARHPKRRGERKPRKIWKKRPIGAAAAPADRSFRVLLYEDLSDEELGRWRKSTACSIREHGERGLLFEGCTHGERTLAALEKRPEVRHVEEWQPLHRAEAYANWILQSNSESCAPVSGCTPLWDEGITGAGQVLGMGDGGVQLRYCQLDDASCSPSASADPPACGSGDYYSPPCPSCVAYCTDPSDVGCVPPDDGNPIVRAHRPFADYSDCDGHGTSTVSLAVGRPPVSLGNSSQFEAYVFRGTAYGARVAFTDIGDGCSPYYDVPVPLDTAYFPWAYAVGARVHSDSWGSSSDGSYSSLTQDIDAFCWYHRDFLPVFAAGNEGSSDGLSSVTTQGSAKNALTVGATLNSLDAALRFPTFVSAYNVRAYPGRFTQDWIAPFSSLGPTQDGRIKPDVVAPGTTMTVANSDRSELSGASEPNCAYPGAFQGEAGTSFSTPVVAASVILLRQWLAQQRGIQNPPASLLKAMVINSAVDTLGINLFDRGQLLTAASIDSDSQLAPFGYHYVQGFGRVSLVNYTSDASARLYLSSGLPSFASSGQHADLCLYVNSSSSISRTPVTLTLVWTDFPASLRDSSQLVNDLDLAVIDPSSCSRYYPNGLRGHTDNVNNVERVKASAAPGSPLFVRVKAARILVGPQDFSLVASVGDPAYALSAVYPCQAPAVCAAQLGSNPLPMESSFSAALAPSLPLLLLLIGALFG